MLTHPVTDTRPTRSCGSKSFISRKKDLGSHQHSQCLLLVLGHHSVPDEIPDFLILLVSEVFILEKKSKIN